MKKTKKSKKSSKKKGGLLSGILKGVNVEVKSVKNERKAPKKAKHVKAKSAKHAKKHKDLFDSFLDTVKVDVKAVKGEIKEKETSIFGRLEEIKNKMVKATRETKIKEILESYDKASITIGVLGGHSALDVCRGAKKLGFKTVAVCVKGREQTYAKYYKKREDGRGIIDEIILVDKFGDIVNRDVQEKLRELNTIFIHNRYFWVYCDFKKIESEFKGKRGRTRTRFFRT